MYGLLVAVVGVLTVPALVIAGWAIMASCRRRLRTLISKRMWPLG